MTHALLQNGDGTYCSRCNCSWDRDEEVDEACSAATTVQDVFDPTGHQIEVTQSRVIVGFAGQKRSGKDTAAEVLIGEHDFERVRFADCLKAMLRTLLDFRGMAPDLIERYVEGDLKEEPCPALNGQTMRHAMQTLGTNWGRKMIDETLWVDATRDRINSIPGSVVVTDVRFPNEADMLKSLGAAVIRIDRDTGHVDLHVSEQLTSALPVDFVVRNDGPDAESLRQQIRAMDLQHLLT